MWGLSYNLVLLTGLRNMARLIDVTPEELETVLDRIQREQITKLEIFGPRVWCGDNPNNLPVHSECEVVYHLHLEMDGLAKSIAKCRSLTHCWLLGHNFDETDVRLIAEGLTNLSLLDVNSPKLGEGGARAIAELLPNLTSLDVTSSNIGESGARAIAERLSNLTSLHIAGNNIGDCGAEAIAEGLAKLTSLSIGSNNIGEAAARAIAMRLTELTWLMCSYDNIGNEGASAIAEGLTNLTWLNVVDCNIGDSGARSFAEGLPNLTSLWLIDNSVTDLSPFALRIKAGWPVLEDFSDDDGLHVENCPLQTPPLGIVEQGPEAVRNYFIARDSSSAS